MYKRYVEHRIQCSEDDLTELRALIEKKLKVDTGIQFGTTDIWFVIFYAPERVNLDFLRPKYLPKIRRWRR